MGGFYQKKRINTIGIFFQNRDTPRFKQIIPEFFSGSVKKNSQHVQTKRSVVCKQQAHAGTDLDLNKSFPSFLAEALIKISFHDV